MLIGFIELKKSDKGIYRLLLLWLVSAPLVISYIVLAIRNHLMDFGFAIAALVSLGLIGLSKLISSSYYSDKYLKIICFVLVALTVYNLVLTNHVNFGRAYDNNANLSLQFLADKIDEAKLPNDAVLAVGVRNGHPVLNYLTDKSVVYFNPDTIKDLIKENKLQDAFDKFGVRFIIGYDKELSDLIIKNSKVQNISNSIDAKDIELPLSDTKSWLLNLIK
jgi:hypothetical protein